MYGFCNTYSNESDIPNYAIFVSKIFSMKNTVHKIAVILASGSGSRFGADRPKQYCDFDGKPMLMHTIDCFSKILPLENILVVIDSAMQEDWTKLCMNYGFMSPQVTYGGCTRTESLTKALSALDHFDNDTIVMIHDGARPLASEDLIRRMSEIPEGYVGAVPAVAVTDTLRHIDKTDGGSVTVDRSEYVAVQTPQTFTLGTLRKSFEHYREYAATDDATLVQDVTGGKIAILEGEHTNIKVTNPADMMIAEALYKNFIGK